MRRITIIDHGKVIAAGTLDALVAQSIGRQRHVTLRLDRPAPPGLGGESAEANGSTLRLRVENVAVELPGILSRIGAAGCRVEDITVAAPSLHEVFIHLTGRELRE